MTVSTELSSTSGLETCNNKREWIQTTCDKHIQPSNNMATDTCRSIFFQERKEFFSSRRGLQCCIMQATLGNSLAYNKWESALIH